MYVLVKQTDEVDPSVQVTGLRQLDVLGPNPNVRFDSCRHLLHVSKGCLLQQVVHSIQNLPIHSKAKIWVRVPAAELRVPLQWCNRKTYSRSALATCFCLHSIPSYCIIATYRFVLCLLLFGGMTQPKTTLHSEKSGCLRNELKRTFPVAWCT